MHALRRGLFALVVVLELVVAQPAAAATPTEVLQSFFARANGVLRTVDPLGDLAGPRQSIFDLVSDVFDFRGAAALALGPAWLSRTPEDQAQFVRVFGLFLERGLVATLASKVSVADGVKVEYLNEFISNDSAGVSTTVLTRGGQELPVDYRFVRRDDGWKVQDVIVDGVSLIANYRAQFARVLGAHPFAEVIARMGGVAPAGTGLVAAGVPEVQAKPDDPPMTAVLQRAQTPPALPASPPVLGPPAPAAPPPAVAASAPSDAPSVGIPPAAMSPAFPIAPPSTPRTRQEIRLAALPAVAPAPERLRAPVPAAPPSIGEKATAAGEAQAGPYWVQLGAFQSAAAAAQLADRYRRDGATVFRIFFANAGGSRVGEWARVRLGPFAHRADAVSKARELLARGQTSFVAGDGD